MKNNTYYHILGISPRASDDDVRKAWRAQALRWHPDRNPRNRPQAQRMFILVNRAYTVLKTQPQRQAYNRILLASSRREPGYARPAKTGHASSRNDNGFIGTIKELLWPFAAHDGAQHG